MIRHAIPALLLASAALAYPALAAEPAFEAFLEKHCVACHGPKKEKGDLRVDVLSRDFRSGLDTHLWHEVIERINGGEMPPRREPQPTQEDIGAFVAKNLLPPEDASPEVIAEHLRNRTCRQRRPQEPKRVPCWHPSGMRFFGALVPVVSLRSTTG